MEELIKLLEDSISKLKTMKTYKLEEFYYYGDIKINSDELIDQGKYFHVPRGVVNKFNKNGYDLIEKSEFKTEEQYLKELVGVGSSSMIVNVVVACAPKNAPSGVASRMRSVSFSSS